MNNFIINNKEAINLSASIISSFAVTLTLLCTIIYVIQTRKMVHLPYSAHLGIDLDQFDFYNGKFVVNNYGPGIATNIKILYCKNVVIRKESDNSKFQYPKCFYTESHGQVANNSETAFKFETNGLVLINPFEIHWISLTGKKYRKYYLYSTDQNMKFKTLTKFEIFKWQLKKYSFVLLSPYNYIMKTRYFEYDYIKNKVIDILENKGLTVDCIADEFNTKNDRDIEYVMNRMEKEKRVVRRNGSSYQLIKK